MGDFHQLQLFKMSGSRYTLDWSFGLVNSAGSYLTCETFQKKVACPANSIKLGKKQILFLEAGTEGTVSLRTHLGNYIRVDGDGKFKADGEKGDEESNIVIEAQADGRWLLKSAKYGWYLGGSGENLSAFISEPQEDRFWKVHLAMHPQITLKNIKRTRYAQLSGDVFQCDADQPWGANATINIVHVDGCYQLQGVNGGYLEDSGRLTEDPTSAATQFILDFHGDVISFKSKKSGKYLTSLGASGLLKATKPGITADEQFQMEDSWPQITLRACKSDKFLSIKGGVEVAAVADEVTNTEIFQVEPQDDGTWILKTMKDKFMGICDGGFNSDCGDASEFTNVSTARGDDHHDQQSQSADTKFTMSYLAGNKVAITASNGKLLKQLMNKQIHAKGDDATSEDCQYVMTIVNRPLLCLRGSFGFVNKLPSGTLTCKSSVPEYFPTSQGAEGYTLDGWTSSDNLINGSGGGGEQYHIELLKESKMAIKYDGKYLAGKQTGEILFDGAAIGPNSTWEY